MARGNRVETGLVLGMSVLVYCGVDSEGAFVWGCDVYLCFHILGDYFEFLAILYCPFYKMTV